MICIVKAILASLAMMFIATNLIGFIVRGLVYRVPSFEPSTERVDELIGQYAARARTGNRVVTLVAFTIAAAYLYALYYYWNYWLALAGLAFMLARIPDLVWEIKSGELITKSKAPMGLAHIIGLILMWGSVPLVWYALCQAA